MGQAKRQSGTPAAVVRAENSGWPNLSPALIPCALFGAFIWLFVSRQIRAAKDMARIAATRPGAPGAEPLRVFVVNNTASAAGESVGPQPSTEIR
jgi:hypothetical protein